MEELSALYPIRTLHEMYEAAVEAPHSFWFVNLVAMDKREMFYVQFDNHFGRLGNSTWQILFPT